MPALLGRDHARASLQRIEALIARAAIGNLVERHETPLEVVAEAAHAAQAVHLVVEIVGPIHDHVEVALMGLDQDRLGRLREQVDRGRREQGDLLGRHRAVERRDRAIQEHEQVQADGRHSGGSPGARPLSLANRKRSAKAEELLQQPIAVEAAQRAGQERQLVLEAPGADRCTRQVMLPGGRLGHGLRDHADAVADDRLVQPEAEPLAAGEVERQMVERQLLERRFAEGFQAQMKGGLDVAPAPDAVAGEGRAGDVAGIGQADRPELDGMLGEEGASGLLARAEPAHQARVAIDPVAVGEVAGARIGLERDHDHRRRGRQIVGVDHLEQMAREARELVVELALDARREKREPFHQALDVGIAAAVAIERQPAADLLVLLRELPGDVAQMPQLVVVIPERGRHPSRGPLGKGGVAVLEIDHRGQQETQGCGLGEQLGLDLEGERAAIHLLLVGMGTHHDAVRIEAWLEANDRVAQGLGEAATHRSR